MSPDLFDGGESPREDEQDRDSPRGRRLWATRRGVQRFVTELIGGIIIEIKVHAGNSSNLYDRPNTRWRLRISVAPGPARCLFPFPVFSNFNRVTLAISHGLEHRIERQVVLHRDLFRRPRLLLTRE